MVRGVWALISWLLLQFCQKGSHNLQVELPHEIRSFLWLITRCHSCPHSSRPDKGECIDPGIPGALGQVSHFSVKTLSADANSKRCILTWFIKNVYVDAEDSPVVHSNKCVKIFILQFYAWYMILNTCYTVQYTSHGSAVILRRHLNLSNLMEQSSFVNLGWKVKAFYLRFLLLVFSFPSFLRLKETLVLCFLSLFAKKLSRYSGICTNQTFPYLF